MSQYCLMPGSRVYVFEDASGLGIYSGYDGNTLFLNAKSAIDQQNVEFNANSTFNSQIFQNILGLEQAEAEFVFQNLIDKKVFCEAV